MTTRVVSAWAVAKRITRKLPELEAIRRMRDPWGRGEGWLWVHYDYNRGWADEIVDLDELGRELGVLRSYETVAEEDVRGMTRAERGPSEPDRGVTAEPQ